MSPNVAMIAQLQRFLQVVHLCT